MTEADMLIAQYRATESARENSKAIIAAGKRFGATNLEVHEAIRGGVNASDFARHHEIEKLAREISSV